MAEQLAQVQESFYLFTAYIDAVEHDNYLVDENEETRRPRGSDYHVTYYQTNGALDSLPTSLSNINVDVSSWGLDHQSIDNDTRVKNGILYGRIQAPLNHDGLLDKVSR